MGLRKLAASAVIAASILTTGSIRARPLARASGSAVSQGSTSEDDFALHEIVSFLSEFSDGLEHIVYCLPKSRRIAEVTQAHGPRAVIPNLALINGLPSDDYVLIAHNHYLSVDGYLSFAQPNLLSLAKIKRAEPSLVEKRMFLEAPSGSDINALAYEEAFWRKKNPQARIRHFIARTSEYHPPRLIEYGLTKSRSKAYTRLFQSAEVACAPEAGSQNCIAAMAKLKDAIKQTVAAYVKAWQEYTSDTLKPDDLGPGKEADIAEFIKQVGVEKGVFVRDLGFYTVTK